MQVILDKEEADLMRDMIRILCDCEWGNRSITVEEMYELRQLAVKLHFKVN